MSYSYCAITKKIPKEAVVGSTTGLVYDKQVITNHLRNKEVCPVTNKNLTSSDLIDVKSDFQVKIPRNNSECSLSGLIESLGLKTNQLLKEVSQSSIDVDRANSELSLALSKYDASLRVICKLTKERDDLRNKFAQTKSDCDLLDAQINKTLKADSKDLRDNQELEILKDRLYVLGVEASEKRKQRKGKIEIIKSDEISQLKSSIAFSMEKSGLLSNSNSNCLAFTAFDSSSQSKIILGDSEGGFYILGKSKEGLEYLNSTNKTSSSSKTNNIFSKQISDIGFMHINPMIFGVSSFDRQAAIYGYSEKLNDLSLFYKITNHSQAVTGFAFHPLSEYFMCSSLDGFFSFHNSIKVRHKIFYKIYRENAYIIHMEDKLLMG